MVILENKVYNFSEINFSISDVPERREPRKVLMAAPAFFDIIDVKNPHMEGQSGKTDKRLAIRQWELIRKEYRKLAGENILEDVFEVPGAENCEDMVFAANQSFPWREEEGKKIVILSKMKHPSRQREVPYFEKFYRQLGYKIVNLKKTNLFEGMGDTIPHYGKKLLYGGYGHRSELTAYEELSALLQLPIIPLELVDERFYHLDTCFLPVDSDTVLITPIAFTQEGKNIIKKMFREVIEVPLEEAEKGFALNAHLINDKVSGKKVAIIQKGNLSTNKALALKGFKIIEVDTSEYMKSGGSVFCMKMMVY